MPKDSNGTATEALCSKCGERPRGQSHDWCNECKSELQKRYNGDRNRMLKAQGYTQGVSALREALASEFARLGAGYFRGDECAALVRHAPAPVYQERADSV